MNKLKKDTLYIKLWYQEFFWLSFMAFLLLIQVSIMTCILIFNEPFFIHMMKIGVILEPLNFGVSGMYSNINICSYILTALNNGYKPFVLIMLFLAVITSFSILIFPFIKTIFRKRMMY